MSAIWLGGKKPKLKPQKERMRRGPKGGIWNWNAVNRKEYELQLTTLTMKHYDTARKIKASCSLLVRTIKKILSLKII